MRSFRFLAVILQALLFSNIFAQSGPGGVGSSTSTTDSLLLWLRADSLITVDGSNYVTSWGDISGNGNDYTTQDGAQFPFNATGLNSRPTVDFTEVNTGVIGEVEGPSTASYFGLNSNDPIRPGDIIIIFQNGTTSGYISQFPANGGGSSFLSMVTQGGSGGAADNGEPDDVQFFVRNDDADGDTFDEASSQGTAADNFFLDDQFHIARFGFDPVGDSIWLFHNSTFAQSVTVTDIGYDGNTGSGPHRLGSSDSGQDYDGQIAEFIVFTDVLNDAEYTVVLNYLNARYALDILTSDFYTGTGFLEDVIGIGNEGGSTHMASQGVGGGLYLSGVAGTSTTAFDADEWLFAGHDGAVTTNTFTDVPDADKTRVTRVWKFEKTEGASNAGFDATVTFDLDELGLSGVGDFDLYKRTSTTGDFTNLGLTPSISGDQVSFTLTDALTDDAEQYFTLAYGASSPGGISANLRLWLQGDRGVETTGSAVDDWRDQTANGNDATDPSALTDLQTNITNFNSGVQFDGDATSLEGAVATTNSNLTFFAVYQDNGATNSNGSLFEFNSGAQSHFLLDNSYAGGAAFTSNIVKNEPALIAIDHPSGTTADLFINGSSFEGGYTTVANSANGTYNYTLGDDDDGGNTFSGTVNELVAFDGTLAPSDREQVESYLAIKYGISLSHDYLRSDGTLIYDLDNSALNDGYENQIVGIGTDITSGLNQKVAKSANDSLVIALEEDYTSSNASRTTTLGDDSFFFVSNDNGNFETTSNSGNVLLNRVWKVSESGTVGTVFLGIPTSLYEFDSLLVSSDPTFTTGVTRVAVSTSGSYNSVSHDFSTGDFFTFTVSQALSEDNGNLLLWLKADVGVTTSGNVVTLWADQSTNGNDANNDDTEFDEEAELEAQTEDPVELANNSFNFNPSIVFNNADRPLTGSYTTTGGFNFFIVGTDGNVGVNNDAWFDSYQDNTTGGSGNNRTWLFESRYASGTDFADNDSTADNAKAIYTIEHPEGNTANIYENGGAFELGYTTNGTNDNDAGLYHYVIGDDATGGNEFTGSIAEFLVFQGSIDAIDRQRIETYLAVKYGISLNNDYVDQSNNIIFDITNSNANDRFENFISALGRNDLYSLNQKVARADSGNLVIALDQNFENSNSSRATSLSDGQYFFTSANTGSVASDSSYRAFIGNRLGRKWKVNETNNPGAVYVAISDTVAANFNVLLVSNDSTFNTGVTEVQLSQSGGFYFAQRDFTSGEYFTFANSVSPGGVGPGLQVWLKADSELTVADWGDQSGNDNDATSPENDPTIVSSGINFNPALQFSTAGDRMQGTVATSTDSLSFLIVAEDRSSASSGGVLIELDAATDLTFNDGSYAGLSFTTPANIIKDTAQLISVVHPEGAGPATVFLNGNSFEAGAVNAVASTTYNYSIGDDVASANGFDGLVSEVIVYDEALTDANREMLESYLAVKYALPVSHDIVASNGSSILDATASSGYLNGLLGLGYDVRTQLDQKVAKSPYDSIKIATTDDFTTANTSRTTAFEDLQYSLITNDGGAYTITADYKAESNVRLERIWEVHELNNPGTVVLALPNSGVFTTINTILLSSDPTFNTGVTEQSLTVSGSNKVVSIDLTDGQYFTFTTADPESNIWYSYLSGNWSDPANWTLDGAISPLYLNPSNEIPSEGDTVVINSGRSITSDFNSILVERVEILGNLDMAATAGHNFTYILGNGTLRLAGATGVDNYPSGIDTLFYSSTEGGTVEYYGTGLTLDTKRRYNNLTINLDDLLNEVEQTADSIWVFGNMNITRGTYQFGSNSVADDEVAEVQGDLVVANNGAIEVGNTNSRHEFNLYGDFTNQGTAEFTNRTSADYLNEATDGIVDVNFVSATQDQLVDLQNTTVFYRIEINKGVDDTYKVSLAADDPSYFSLLGFADEGHPSSAQLTTNDNALGLIYGTIEIGNNIQIGELVDGGNYNISEGASLVINGGGVTGDRWIVTYGSLVINAGTLDLGVGTVLRNSGFWEVNGGQVDMGHFRTSALGFGNDGSWTQTGGIVNVTGSGSQSDYYTFSLTYETCSFTMTGGQLNISPDNSAPTGLKGLFLNAATENTTVTGGTVTIDQAFTEDDSLFITSSVPLYNLILTQSVANANPNNIIIVTGGNSGGGAPDGVDLVGQTLEVFNDLIIDNSDGNTTTVDFDGNDLDITGNLEIRAGSVTDFTDMTVRMIGNGSSDLDIQLATTLTLDSLEINKNDLVNVSIINGQSTALQIDEYLSILSGNFNIADFDLTLDGDLNIADTIGTSSSTGLLSMLGAGETVAQTITSSNGGFIYDALIDNNMNITLGGGDIGFDSLELNDGIVDIDVNKVTLNSPIETTGTFGTDLYFRTAGNPTDGGLEFLFNADESITYPFGISGFYTPLVADVDTTNNDVGYIAVNPVNAKLGTISDDVGVTDFLNYYWKVGHSGFDDLPRINSYTFDYIDNAADDDVSGTETNFQPGYVEDGVDADADGDSYTRTAVGSTADVNTVTDVITFTFAATEDTVRAANYTAGEADAFAGTVTVFYSRKQQGDDQKNWTDATSWSTDGVNQHAGVAATSYPGENSDSDVVVMGFGGISSGENFNTCNPCTIVNSVRHDHRIRAGESITVAEIIYDQNPAAQALNNIDTRIRVFETASLIAERVTGRGTMFQRVNATNIGTITADFNDFNDDPDNGWFLQVTGGTSIVISDRFEFPTLRVFGGGRDVSYTQDVTTRGLVVDNNADLYINQNFTINGTARIGLNGGGELLFGSPGDVAVGSNVTFECDSLILTSNDASAVSVVNAGTDEHTVRVNSGISLAQGLGFDLYNAGTSSAILEAAGTGSHVFENGDGMPIELYRLVINKGSDTTNAFTLNTDLDILGDNTTSPQSVELQNGKLILNDAGLSIELADNSDFDIPGSAGLEITQGAVTATGANIILDGLLRINGGSATLASSDIEYSSSGNALIDVSSGTLNIGGQVRRTLTSSNGVLKYRQSGGDVDIATDGAGNSNRGAFEILNSGSEFTLTGGTFNVERGVTGDANLSLELSPETFDLSSSTISVFENLGADYGANFFNISSTIPLNNLLIANTIDLPDVQLFNQNLEVNNLTINTNQTLLANNFNVSINGDFTNDGTYTNTITETIFAGSGAQSISGGGSFTIYDLRKSGSGTTTSSVDLNVSHDLILTAGILDIGSNAINLTNDAFIQSTLSNSGGNGLVFNGTANQELNGQTNTAVDIGTITISNSNGVDIPDGNGYDFNITQELRLNGGVFNIGGSLVTMVAGAPITEVSTFNVNNMVQTNSSFTDNGLKIDFFGVDSDTVVFFPVGELKYTPVEVDLNTGTTAGSIRVRPANERHPTIVEDTEAPNPEITDVNNVLQYHWIVVAEDVTNATGEAIFFYNADDVLNLETDTADWISARLLSNDINWDKFTSDLFQGAPGDLRFRVPLTSFAANDITGDYTAGADDAIPDQLAQYTTDDDNTGTFNYSVATSWDPVGSSPAVTPGVGPVGAQITVQNGDELVLDIDNIRLYAVEIESGGSIRVPSGITGVRLGTVTGNGTIILEDNELLPTGEYTDFFACDGGALQYSGSTTYNVLSGISQIRKVVFEGTGTRTLPNNLLTVCDTLEINGPTIAFSSGLNYVIGDADTDRMEIQAGAISVTNGSTIDVVGDLIMSGGTLTGATNTDISISDDLNFSGGTINWNGTDITMDGTSEQLIDGAFTGTATFDDLTINNSGSGITINSGDIEVGGLLTLTDGLVNNSSTETLTLTSSGSWTGASSASYVTGPLSKENVAATSTFEFPVGKAVRYAPVSVVNVGVGGDDWTAEYFTSTNPTYDNTTFDNSDPGSGFNILSDVESSDRWEVTSVGSNTAQVRATYGPHNAFPGTNIRLVWWDDEAVLDGDGADNRWENQGGQVVGDASAGTVTSENTIFFSTRQLAMGYAPESLLPVELLDFTAEAIDNKVELTWSTVSETNNDYFEVMHSTDGIVFTSIGIVEGSGTTNELITYSMTHKKPSLGDNYYQLKQVDFDGTETLYSIIKVYNDYYQASMAIKIYPNPTTQDNIGLIVTTGDNHTPIFVRIIDQSGRVYYQRSMNASLNIDEKVNPDLNMVPGIYYMIVNQGDQIQRQKIVIR